MKNNGIAENNEDKVETDKSGYKKVRISDIRQGIGHEQVTGEVMETFFQRTKLMKRGLGATNEGTVS